MKYKELPLTLEIDGKVYFLFYETFDNGDDIFQPWFGYRYGFDENSIPPMATDGSTIYYLSTIAPSKEVAYNNMLERINNIIEII